MTAGAGPARMTARSVVLSVLLGAHPACATAAELIRLTADFEIKEPTLRVALTRMVAAGDLIRSDDGYRLSERLLDRQRRQDDALRPVLRDWDGSWLTAVVTSVGEDARTRSELRKMLQQSRFGELREAGRHRRAGRRVDRCRALRLCEEVERVEARPEFVPLPVDHVFLSLKVEPL